MTFVKVGIVADFLEEGWPSMILIAEELVNAQNALRDAGGNTLHPASGQEFSCHLIRPAMPRRLSQQGATAGRGYTFDRLAARFYDYAQHLKKLRSQFALFHLADHSYSQLVHVLPASRTVVTCHDLDTFRCLWEPKLVERGPMFRAMTRRILTGMQKAAHVCCVSHATREELLARRLLPPERTSVVHSGVRTLFRTAEPGADAAIGRLLMADVSNPQSIRVLHVGSTIRRKRIDILLEVFCELLKVEPRAILYRVGGPFTPAQQAMAESLGIAAHIRILPHLTGEELAALYRGVDLVLQPSDAEGFGLPVIEALASGTPVLASDLPVLREVGGSAAAYARVGDVADWLSEARRLLAERTADPDAWAARREACRQQGMKFSWADTARQVADIYRNVLSSAGCTSATGSSL